MPYLSSVGNIMAKRADGDADPRLAVGNTFNFPINAASESPSPDPGSASNASTSSSLIRAPFRMQTENYMRLLANKKTVGLRRQLSTPTATGFRKLEGEPQLEPTATKENLTILGNEAEAVKNPDPNRSPYQSLRTSKTTSSLTSLKGSSSMADIEPNVWSTPPPGRTPWFDLKEEVRRTLPRVNSDAQSSNTIIHFAPSNSRPSPSPPLQIDQARLAATKKEVRKILYGPKQTNNTSPSLSSTKRETLPIDKRLSFVIHSVRQTLPRSPSASDSRKYSSSTLTRANSFASNLPGTTTSKGGLKTSKTSSAGLSRYSTTESSQSALVRPEVRLKPKASELSLEELLKVPSLPSPEVEEELRQMVASKSPALNSRRLLVQELSTSDKNSLAYELENAHEPITLFTDRGSDENLSESDASLPQLTAMFSDNCRPVFGWNDEGRQSFVSLDTGKISSTIASITENPFVHLLPPAKAEVPDHAKNLKRIREQAVDIQVTLKILDQNLVSLGNKSRHGLRHAPDVTSMTSIIKEMEENANRKSSSRKVDSKEATGKPVSKKPANVSASKTFSDNKKNSKSAAKKERGLSRPVDSTWNPTFDELEAYLLRVFRRRRNKKASRNGNRTRVHIRSLETQLFRQSEELQRYHEQQSVLVSQLLRKQEHLLQLIAGDDANVEVVVSSDVWLALEAGSFAGTPSQTLTKLRTTSATTSRTDSVNESSPKPTMRKEPIGARQVTTEFSRRATILSMSTTQPRSASKLKDAGSVKVSSKTSVLPARSSRVQLATEDAMHTRLALDKIGGPRTDAALQKVMSHDQKPSESN